MAVSLFVTVTRTMQRVKRVPMRTARRAPERNAFRTTAAVT